MNYGLLVSGNLGYQMLNKINENKKVIFVMTDSNSSSIINFCQLQNIPCYKGNPRGNKSESFLNDNPCDVILSINYLFIVDKEVINHPKKIIVNFHGSLLPKYRGRTPHVWAIINNEIETGITAHLIDENCDTGDIIAQMKINIDFEDTGADILEKFNFKYWDLIQNVCSQIENDCYVLSKQDETKATFFGKRTPEDGLINWDWQKERINNWVRAQADPYPGAFTFCENEKIVIDKIKFEEDGYEFNMPNGLVISNAPLKIKTPNGVISVEKFRGKTSNININSILR